MVIKACTTDPNQFEMIAATLLEHYGSIHLRENSKTWNDKTSWDSKGGKGKGKTQGKNFRRVGYVRKKMRLGMIQNGMIIQMRAPHGTLVFGLMKTP